MNNIKIVFCDIDGTLTTKKRKYRVSVYDKLKIKELQLKKIHFVLNTGRSLSSSLEVWNDTNLNEYGNYLIHSNGAQIINLKTKESLFESFIKPKHTIEFLEFIKTLDKKIYFKVGEKKNFNYFHKKNSFIEKASKNRLINIENYDINEYKNVGKIGIFHSFIKSKNISLIEILKAKFPYFEFTLTFNKRYIEITNLGINKLSSAQILLRELKLTLNDSCAIGDSNNDKKILEKVKYSVSMDNSPKEIKKISSYRTSSVKKSGVGKIINYFLKN